MSRTITMQGFTLAAITGAEKTKVRRKKSHRFKGALQKHTPHILTEQEETTDHFLCFPGPP